MTEIDRDILNSVPGAMAFNRQEEKKSVRHNWLYSVVPSIKGTTADGIYLVGYCKNDRKYFTVRLKESAILNHVLVEPVDVPTYGCEPVE